MIENKKKPNKEFGEKKQFRSPILRKLGTLQRMTMGGSGAPYDSGTNGFAESTAPTQGSKSFSR